mgnify:CR=1 FL=1
MWNMDSLLEDKCFSNVNTFSEVHFPIPKTTCYKKMSETASEMFENGGDPVV